MLIQGSLKGSGSITHIVACSSFSENIWATVFPKSVSFPGSLGDTAALEQARCYHFSLLPLPCLLDSNVEQ